MKNNRLKSSIFVSLVLLSTMLTATLSATAQDEQNPRYGGTLIVGDGKFGSFNPYIEATWETYFCNDLIFSSPVSWYEEEPHFRPELAESWIYSTDGSIIFQFRKNVTWHDGTPFTIEDAKWALELFNEKKGWAWFWEREVTIEQVGDWGIKISFDRPVDEESILFAFAYSGFMFPRHLYEGTDFLTNPANLHPIGTGPFKLESFVAGDYAVLVRNPNYFREGLPYLDKVIVRIIPDQVARVAALEKGEIDYLPMFASWSQLDRVTKTGNVKVDFKSVHGSVIPIFFNLDHNFTNNKMVRQAIDYAIDKEDIVRKVTYGFDQYTGSFQHPDVPYWKAEPRYDYNKTKAKEMLDAAGYPVGTDGKRFKLRLTFTSDHEDVRKMGEMVREYLLAVDIDAELVLFDRPTTVQKLFVERDFDMGCVGTISTGPHPLWGLYLTMHSSAIGMPWGNPSGFNSTYVDGLLDEAVHTVNATRKKELMYLLQDIAAEELHVIPALAMTFPHLHDGEFIGIPGNYMSAYIGPGDSAEYVWWVKGTPSGDGNGTEGQLGLSPEIIAAIVIGAVVVIAGAAIWLTKKMRRRK